MNQKRIKKQMLEGDTIEISGIIFNKVTASSFTLCEMLELSMLKDNKAEFSQIEILMFLYLHHIGSREAREIIFDTEMGVDSKGRSKAFLDACLDWGDSLSITDYTKLAQGVKLLLDDAFSGAIEEAKGTKEGNARKVA